MLHHIFNDQHFSTLFENSCVGILVINKDGTIEAVNKLLLSEFGYEKDELLYQSVDILIPEPLRHAYAVNRAAFVQNPVNISIPADKNPTGVKKDGTEIPIEVALGYYADNGHTSFIAFVKDISRKKETEDKIKRLTLELDQKIKESTRSLKATVEQLSRQIKENERKDEELQKALEKEKELNELKSRFVSAASHEFRNPLSGVLASTYLLSKYTKEDDQPQRDKHIRRIISSVNMLNEVLSDFLSIDKIEQGNFKPTFDSFDIDAVIDEITQSMQHMQKRGQKITYARAGDTGNVYSDRSFVQHIVTNLLSNAVKYSSENSQIRLQVSIGVSGIIISIKDNGIGIPSDEIKNLYQRFFRSSNAAYIEGTGLGLSIVKRCVDLLNGKIECKSELNKGTEFIVTLNNIAEPHEENTYSRRQRADT